MLRRILVLQVVHEGVAFALQLGFVQVAERLQALGGHHRVPVLGRVHEAHVGEAARAIAQAPVLAWVLQVIRGDHVTATALRV